MISGPSEDAVGITTIRASRPPAAATNSLRMRRLRSLSSAPPMIMSGPGMRPTLWAERIRLVRTIVVMRHAKAEQSGATDFERLLAERGHADAAEAGRWLAAEGVEPELALVSASTRTQQTWEALVEAAGWDLEPELDEGLYSAGTQTALD